IASSRVWPSTCTWPGSSARRSARRRSCSGDSSPDTYSVVTPARSRRAAHCSSSVDFPIPGSPPTRTTDPGTTPPPSTKSNSARPVRHRPTPPPSTADRRTGGLPVRSPDRPTARPPGRPVGSSTRVFQAPHASQRPPHLGCSAPHSLHRNTEPALAATGRLRRGVARRVVVEAGVLLLEKQLHGPGGPVALLPDGQLRQPLDAFVGLRIHRTVVELLAIDEADDIGVLLDRPGLSQVGELRAPVLAPALLRRPRQLRQRDDRDVELLRERFERAGDVGDLLLAALGIGGALHQLEIVDNEHADVVLRLEAPGLGAHGQGSEGGRVVDPDRR